jgi:capsular exopolysaccharide synthesis family protein
MSVPASTEPSTPSALREQARRSINFTFLLRAAKKRPELIVACWLSVVALAVFWTLGTVKTYRTESLIRLDPSAPRPLGQRVELVDQTSSYWNRREFYESEFRVIKSMRLATAVVRTLGLNADPSFLAVRNADRASFKPVSVEDAARLLISRVNVEAVKESSLAIIQYEDTDKQRCVKVLNTLVRTYLAQNLEQTSSVSASAAEWLNGQLLSLRSELEKSEVALNEFREKNDILSVSLEDRHNITSAQVEQISKDTLVFETRKFEIDARVTELRKIDDKDPEQAGAAELLQSVVLSDLRRGYAEQKQKLDELLSTYDEQNPKVLGARAKLKQTESAIAKEIRNIREAAFGDQRRIGMQISALRRKDEELRKQAHELQALEIPYNQLNRTKTNNEKLYGLVLERARETDLTRMININNIRVIDEAIEPVKPFRPNGPLTISLGVVVGLLLGIGATVLRDLSDRSLKTPADIEDYLGVSCLGLLPTVERDGAKRRRSRKSERARVDPNDNPDLIVALRPESGVAEAARAIRTNLMFMSPDRVTRAIAVTSALPEEGKTTVACSLAIALAQSGLRTVLVDTDLRRPRLHRSMRMSNDVGVTMACTGQAPLDECLRDSVVANLSVLTSGPIPPNPAEMIHSTKFEALVKQLLERFDRVVFDSPPILPVTDAAILAQVVDGVVVVARGFRTQRTATGQAIRLLLDVKAHVIGVVLNAVDLSRRDYKEYYYYYRREGYYTKDPDEKNLLRTPSSPAADSPPAQADTSSSE